jgi:ubiquinone/menaquinone biosynthesis C-methylase UbiE
METPERTTQRIFGERSTFYTRSAVHKDPEVLNRIIKLAAPRTDSLALDVATGSGHTAVALAPHLAAVICIDITNKMLAEAQTLTLQLGITNIQYCLANAHALPFPDSVFDIVTCRRAAHHFSDVAQALREMKRVVQSNGRIVVDDRSVPEDDFVNSCMNQLDRLHDASHVHEYSPSQWRRLLEAVGFTVDQIDPYSRHLPLSSLTTNVSSKNTERIHAIVNNLTQEQKRVMNVIEVGGETYLNHWYVMLSAHLADKPLAT